MTKKLSLRLLCLASLLLTLAFTQKASAYNHCWGMGGCQRCVCMLIECYPHSVERDCEQEYADCIAPYYCPSPE